MLIFFIARATAPILPECDVSTKTILICDSKVMSFRVKKMASLPKIIYFMVFSGLNGDLIHFQHSAFPIKKTAPAAKVKYNNKTLTSKTDSYSLD
jgi:hypothetical protein